MSSDQFVRTVLVNGPVIGGHLVVWDASVGAFTPGPLRVRDGGVPASGGGGAVQNPQIAGALVPSPGGISSTAGLMLGLANLSPLNVITPKLTGRLNITICGVVAQNTTADGAQWHIRTGVGTPPINGGPLAGTQSGGQQSMTFLTGVLKIPFSLSTYVTGLTLGTDVWIDLVLAAVTGGIVTMSQVMVVAFEF